MSGFGIIVDGYSTGAGLAREFLKHGIHCLHVQSQTKIPKVYAHTFNPQNYEKNFVYSDNLEILTNKLKLYHPHFVVAGAECGVELTDKLSHALNLPCNDIKSSTHRRNKYLMIEKVKSEGIQVIPSFKTSQLDEAVKWATEQNTWPLIVKPLNSAGGEGVRVCKSTTDIIAAYSDIMSTRINMLGFENHAILIQHYIQGDEYVVNTVSYDGDHKLCELWSYTRYKKKSGQQIYDTARLVEYDNDKHKDVINYAINIIDALGIKYGPSHVEIIKNENGCYLIELGARLMGANLPFSLMENCITTPQSIYTVTAYAKPRKFIETLSTHYRIKQPLIAVFMVSNSHGNISAINHIDKIKSLPSFYDMKLAVKVNDHLNETIDYQTSPGMIYLSHKDQSIIDRDKAMIRELEFSMFYFSEKKETNIAS